MTAARERLLALHGFKAGAALNDGEATRLQHHDAQQPRWRLEIVLAPAPIGVAVLDRNGAKALGAARHAWRLALRGARTAVLRGRVCRDQAGADNDCHRQAIENLTHSHPPSERRGEGARAHLSLGAGFTTPLRGGHGGSGSGVSFWVYKARTRSSRRMALPGNSARRGCGSFSIRARSAFSARRLRLTTNGRPPRRVRACAGQSRAGVCIGSRRSEIEFGDAVIASPACDPARQLHARRIAIVSIVVRNDPEVQHARATQAERASGELVFNRHRKQRAAELRAPCFEDENRVFLRDPSAQVIFPAGRCVSVAHSSTPAAFSSPRVPAIVREIRCDHVRAQACGVSCLSDARTRGHVPLLRAASERSRPPATLAIMIPLGRPPRLSATLDQPAHA